MVAQTLEAHAMQMAKTSQKGIPIAGPEEQHSVEITQEPTPQENNEAAAESEALQGGELPESHYIWNILGHRQFFPIGCEASSADDWAKYLALK